MNIHVCNYDPISLGVAKMRATELKFQLESLCDEFEIAGSVRRKQPYVKDIEIVCVPKHKEVNILVDLFPKKFMRNQVIDWIEDNADRSLYVLKGGPKYYQFVYQNGVTVDLFMTTVEEFGRMLAIRTGPENYSKKMAARWVDLGYHGIDGKLIHGKTGEQAGPFRTELEFFEFLGWNYVKPEARK
ncbi:hypothetical protein [Gracilimonas tropica]|uniref:hypothetical protein n=1 Tax=Gracilimonas tropica TaxID=454600 RepID=UPI000371D2ED|nr:hypothetical protein [Gracilimonas tropica]